jgi:hypothetical protein
MEASEPMIASISRTSAAAAVTAALALAGSVLALPAPSAHASVSSAPCSTSVQLAKHELYANVAGRTTLVGKLYVFDEGSKLCAVTTTVGTAAYGQTKAIQVRLTADGQTETDSGPYHYYAGRIRLPDDGNCFLAYGQITLKNGVSVDAYAECPVYRRKHMS